MRRVERGELCSFWFYHGQWNCDAGGTQNLLTQN
jgi:hypothetical protein